MQDTQNGVRPEEYVDIEGALARVRGNKAIYNRMLGLFLKSAEFDAFEQALAAGDYPKAAEVAHGIKGMTGNLSLTKVFETSNELMIQLRQGPPDPALLESYRQALQTTRALVEQMVAEGG